MFVAPPVPRAGRRKHKVFFNDIKNAAFGKEKKREALTNTAKLAVYLQCPNLYCSAMT